MTTTHNETAAKNAEISRQILARVQAGATLAQAMDAVLGDGTHAAVAGALYDALRARGTR